MDTQNLDHMVERCPADARRKLGLLLEHGSSRPATREVPDPYYGGPDGFEHVLDLVEPACDALVVQLAKSLRPA